MKQPLKIRGMFRLQIEDGPTGKIVGDSGWKQNQITNLGFLNMVNQMDKEKFGNCSNAYECEAACPKEISVAHIARMNKDYGQANLPE